MRLIALMLFVTGLALQAQPDLLTQAPAVIAKCAPQYTEQARRAKVEGTVVLNVQIYPDGVAHKVQVQRGLGSGLDAKAIQAVKEWRFSPGRKDGKLVAVPATIDVKFRLNDTSEPCRIGPEHMESRPRTGRA